MSVLQGEFCQVIYIRSSTTASSQSSGSSLEDPQSPVRSILYFVDASIKVILPTLHSEELQPVDRYCTALILQINNEIYELHASCTCALNRY